MDHIFTTDHGFKYKVLSEKYAWKEAVKLQQAEWFLPLASDLQLIKNILPRNTNFWTLEESTDDKQFAIVYGSNYGRCFQIKPAKESVILFAKNS